MRFIYPWLYSNSGYNCVFGLADLEQETNLELLNLHCWLKANKLSLNVSKTEFTVIGSRQNLLAESHNEIDIKLEDQVNRNVDHAKSLGLIIDNRLSLDYCSLVWDGLSDQLSDKLQKLQLSLLQKLSLTNVYRRIIAGSIAVTIYWFTSDA